MARLLPPESASLADVAQEFGVSTSTLEKWRDAALSQPASVRQWTPAARFEALLTTAAMNEQKRSAWCRVHGVYPDFHSKALIVPFDESILVRLAGLDEQQLHTVLLSQVGKTPPLRRHLRAVVQPYGLWLGVELDQLVHHPYQPARWNRGTALNAQRLPVALPIDHVQGPEGTAVVHRVAHEVQGPDAVDFLVPDQRLPLTRGYPLPGLALQVQFHGAVHPIHFLVVPAMLIGTQPVEALPESPATALADHLVQGRNHRRSLDRPVHRGFVQRRPRETHDPASFAAVVVVLSHQAPQTRAARRHRLPRSRPTTVALARRQALVLASARER